MAGIGNGGAHAQGGSPTETSVATPSPTPHRAPIAYSPGFDRDHLFPFMVVHFAAGTPYADALRAVVALGLQTVGQCDGSGFGVTGGAATMSTGTRWHPVGEIAGYTPTPTTTTGPALSVHATPLAAPDWLDQLDTSPLVASLANQVFFCADRGVDPTPVPGQIYFLTEDHAGGYVRVRFARSVTYDEALSAVNDLGFRLADPCTERAQPKPAWHSPDEGQAYAASGALVLATTGANSTGWLDQVRAAPGVTSVETPYAAAC